MFEFDAEPDPAADIKFLSLAIKALIETHPNREWFHEKFLHFVDHPEEADEFFNGLGQSKFDRGILITMLHSAAGNKQGRSETNSPQAPAPDQPKA